VNRKNVATVTLNPAIDHTIFVSTFTPNGLNRAEAVEYHIGGKGINVSKVLSKLGCSSVALGFLGRNALFFEEELNAVGIETDFVEVLGRTRTNIKVIDRSSSGCTEINEPGPFVDTASWENLVKEVASWAGNCEYVVIAGSLPPGLPPDSYQLLIREVKKQGAKPVLDAEGEALKKGLEAVPFMIKPNIHELEGLIGKQLAGNKEEMLSVCQELLSTGISVVVISMGSEGSIYADKDGVFRVYPLSLEVKNTVGAGDAMVAGLIHGMIEGLQAERLAAFGAAVSACQIADDFGKLKQFAEEVRVERWV